MSRLLVRPRRLSFPRLLVLALAGLLVVSTGLAFGPSAAAASLPAGSYLVVGGDNGSMSFVDRATGSSVAQVPIDGTAFPVAVGSGNRTVFSNSINGIAVVDPSTLTVTTTLVKPGQGDAPYSTFALSGDRTTLVAANRTGSVIDVYDALNLTLEQSVTFAQGGNPSLAVSADGSLLYIAPDGSPVVSVIDLAAGTVKSSVTLPNQVVDLKLGANGTLYALLQTGDKSQAFVSAIDTATGVAAAPWPVGIGFPAGLAVVTGGPVYVTGLGANGGSLVALDATFGTVAKTTPLTSGFVGPPTATPNGSTVYVAVQAQQQVLAVAIPSLTVQTITTPYYQNALAVMDYEPPVTPGPGPSTTTTTTTTSPTPPPSPSPSPSTTSTTSATTSTTSTTSTPPSSTTSTTSVETSASRTSSSPPRSTAGLASTGSNAGTVATIAVLLLVLGAGLVLLARRVVRRT